MTTRRARNQVLGKTQAAGLSPTAKGIASNRIEGFVRRAVGAADALHTVLAARDSGDPAAAAIATRLLENPEFIRALITAVEKLKADITAAKAEPKGGDFMEEGNSPNHRPSNNGSGLPGTDGARTTAPGSYTREHLMRDIAIQNNAVAQLSAKTGMDAARAQVAASPLIPAWDSSVWTPEARQAFRDRASYDGAAAAILKKAGDLPTYVREHDAASGTDGLYALHPEAYEPKAHPRAFDR